MEGKYKAKIATEAHGEIEKRSENVQIRRWKRMNKATYNNKRVNTDTIYSYRAYGSRGRQQRITRII